LLLAEFLNELIDLGVPFQVQGSEFKVYTILLISNLELGTLNLAIDKICRQET